MAEPDTAVDVIDHNGDLYLHVFSPDARLILVSSDVLTSTSSVFKALLSSNYLEGQTTRSSEAPQTISLPEDHSVAMRTMCAILHTSKPWELPSSLTPPELRQLTIVFDKYSLFPMLSPLMQGYLFRALDYIPFLDPHHTRDFDDVLSIAISAYLMNHTGLFRTTTERLIRWSVDTPAVDFTPLPGQVKGQYFVLFALDGTNRRSDAIDRNRRLVWERIAFDVPRLGSLDDQVWWASLNTIFCTEWWPGRRRTPGNCIDLVRRLQAVATSSQLVAHMDADLSQFCDGLCLICVREGKDLLRKCREPAHWLTEVIR